MVGRNRGGYELQVDVLFFDDSDNTKIEDVKNILYEITSISVDRDNITFDSKNIPYELRQSSNNKYVYLILKLGKKNKENASILSNLKDLIRQGDHRAGYKITISYDESSMYFNEKLFSFIAEHESKLRQFIYLILIDIFGSDWVGQTLEKEKQSEFKKNLRNKSIIEKGLEAFSYQDYISFLFERRPNKFTNDRIDDVIEKIISTEEINKEKLIDFLRENKSYSLWESSFSTVDYPEAKEEIKLIRDIRNGVMHNKEITTKEFDENKVLIRKSNKGLDKAIQFVKSEHSREIVPIEVLNSLQDTLSNIGAKYAKLIEPMLVAVSAISEGISKISNSSTLNMAKVLQNNLANTISTFPNIYQNTEFLDSIWRMQNIQQAYIDSMPNLDNLKINLPDMYLNSDFMDIELTEEIDESIDDEDIEDENSEHNEENSDPNDE